MASAVEAAAALTTPTTMVGVRTAAGTPVALVKPEPQTEVAVAAAARMAQLVRLVVLGSVASCGGSRRCPNTTRHLRH